MKTQHEYKQLYVIVIMMHSDMEWGYKGDCDGNSSPDSNINQDNEGIFIIVFYLFSCLATYILLFGEKDFLQKKINYFNGLSCIQAVWLAYLKKIWSKMMKMTMMTRTNSDSDDLDNKGMSIT